MLKRYSARGGEMGENLEARVARQFSSLYLTLVSVLVGLVLSDLFSAIHDRMTLWPLTLETGRTWCQIFGNTLAVLSSWVTYSHLGAASKSGADHLGHGGRDAVAGNGAAERGHRPTRGRCLVFLGR